jgi:formylglycine-generating enzyme required for sulfatase activity
MVALVRPLCVERSEVTVARYAACVAAGRCTAAGVAAAAPRLAAAEAAFLSRACNAAVAGRGRHPVNCVDWHQASAYCRSQGRRLPTAEEWAWAARGRDEERRYPWGGEKPDETRLDACGSECVADLKKAGRTSPQLFTGSDDAATTAPVGSYPDGDARDGLHDMAGNVWEWTATRSGAGTYALRGGGWRESSEALVGVGAAKVLPGTARLPDAGFRCVADLEQAAAAPADPAARKAADALTACAERAQRLFVTRCRQSCQIEAKGQNPVKTEECLMKCGTQQQMSLFIRDCQQRAQRAAPASKP